MNFINLLALFFCQYIERKIGNSTFLKIHNFLNKKEKRSQKNIKIYGFFNLLSVS